MRDGARWLGDALRSALAECGPDDEVIVVDDGSRDQPERVVPNDPRLRLLVQAPLGIVAALERGRAACTAPFIARLDADDVALPGRIGTQLAAFEADPGLVAVGGQARIQRDDGPVPEGMLTYVAWVNGLDELEPQLLVESPLFHPAVTFRASAVAAVGGYRPGDLPEDYDLWLRLVAAGGRIANVPREVVLLRDRSDRLTRTDPRYRAEAFRAVKMDWLAARLAPSGRALRIAVWGAGKAARPWLRWVRQSGHDLCMVVDPFQRGERQGLPIRAPEALASAPLDLVLVAVGSRGARALIREALAGLRPDLVEGAGWWAVA